MSLLNFQNICPDILWGRYRNINLEYQYTEKLSIFGTETEQSVTLYVRAHIDHALYISKLKRVDFMFIYWQFSVWENISDKHKAD